MSHFDIRMLNCDITLLHCAITLMTSDVEHFFVRLGYLYSFFRRRAFTNFKNLIFGVAKSLVDVVNIEY